jgi:hypothetical protein
MVYNSVLIKIKVSGDKNRKNDSHAASSEIPQLLWARGLMRSKDPATGLFELYGPSSYPHTLISVLILYSRIFLGLPSGHFSSGFRTKMLPAFLISSMHATRKTTQEIKVSDFV